MFRGSMQSDRMSSSGRLPHPYIKARVRGSRGSKKCALASLSVGSAATTAAVGQPSSGAAREPWRPVCWDDPTCGLP